MSFLDNVVNTVKGFFAPAKPKPIISYIPPKQPSHTDSYNQTMAQLDRVQNKLNPYIAKANDNMSLINRYIAGNLQAPATNSANYPVDRNNTQLPGSTMANYGFPQVQEPQVDYGQLIGHLGSLVQQQHQPVELSADMSPYLNAANNITNRRHQTEQALLGQMYG